MMNKYLHSALLAFLLIFSGKIIANKTVPFSTDSTHLTIWNGTEYIPFFMKGINLGAATPGNFPGQLEISSEQYARWFRQIKDAGFNCIRVYTLHFPRFFEELHKFNSANEQNPLLFLQGVWLEEEVIGYNHDLYTISGLFKNEIEENIDCVHGNRTISTRAGKAHGTYTMDVSKWCLGYVVGREIHPIECLTTDQINAGTNSFNGNHFSISGATPSEAWITEWLDHTVEYERTNYQTERPVTSSSWPTLDPFDHPEEFGDEDTTAIDYAKINLKDAPAGMFISYHAYPYYPDFISHQQSYQGATDNYGPNSYLAYLTELKNHYAKFPLIIAEYGVPSSWAIAHYSTSGMNHGGFDEYNQGLSNLRMLNNMQESNCGGGIQFTWMDEWFKRTWVTDNIDYIPSSRVLWHNIAAAEQNYGLIGFEKQLFHDTIVSLDLNSEIPYIISDISYTFFELEIGLKNPLLLDQDLWVAFDTYSDSLGESILPTGDTIPHRSEFALKITNYSAQLYVTEAYDIYGIYHNVSKPEQLYHSIATDGANWNILRLKNNTADKEIQYIGNLKINYDFQPQTSKDAVTIYDEKIKIRIPWSYLNVVSPDQMKVFHDDRATSAPEDTISDGFSIAINYKNEWRINSNRLKWNPWVYISDTDVEEYFKKSYYVMKDNLYQYNTDAVAFRDSFLILGPSFPVDVPSDSGLLANDIDIDGGYLYTLLDEPPRNGKIILDNDGAFSYTPDQNFNGLDSISYYLFDGNTISKSNWVILEVNGNTNASQHYDFLSYPTLQLNPNPAHNVLQVTSQESISSFQIFDMNGLLVLSNERNQREFNISVQDLQQGVYIAVAKINNKFVSAKFIKK